jgi:hypothetical protein
MATNTITGNRQRTTTGIATMALGVTFALGAVAGALVIQAPRLVVPVTQPAAVAAPAPVTPSSVKTYASGSELDRVLADLGAAAARHDARMFAAYREQLVKLVGSTPMDRYQEMTGS